MDILVSIIVPIYNVEAYLSKCVNSILRQTHKNIEVLLIDDGSTDKSPKICDRYQKKDDRVKVVHCKNGGVSAARNIGIDMAQGEYIVFVDSDDWLPKDAIENLVRGIEKNDADFCYGAIKEINLIENRLSNFVPDLCVRNGAATMIPLIENMNKGPCGKIYKKSLIYEHNIYFCQDIRYAEDAIFVFQYLQKCNVYCSIPNTVYHYNRIVLNSASRKQYDKIAEWEYRKVCELEGVFSKCLADEAIVDYLLMKYVRSLDGRCKEIVKCTSSDQEGVDGIRKVCELYREKINALSQNAFGSKDFGNVLYMYAERISGEDYEGLYSLLKQMISADVSESHCKTTVRKVLIPFKRFFVFGRF